MNSVRVRLVCIAFIVVCGSFALVAPSSAATYTSPDGISYAADPADVTAGATVTNYAGSATDVVIPDSVDIDEMSYAVTAIGTSALENEALTSVELPASLRTIGNRAFRDNLLTHIEFGGALRTIEPNAFAENDLISVVLPDSVRTVGGAAFFNNHVREVDLGAVTSIGNFAFTNSSLTTLVLPASVTSIGRSAFMNNTGLRRVTALGPAPTTFTSKGPAGSLGKVDTLVLYDPGFGGSESSTDFTRGTWRGYRSAPAWSVASFDTGGHGTAPVAIRVPYGESLVSPSEPTAAHWTFEGWFRDAGLTLPYDFAEIVADDFTLYASWVETASPGAPPEPEPEPENDPEPDPTLPPVANDEPPAPLPELPEPVAVSTLPGSVEDPVAGQAVDTPLVGLRDSADSAPRKSTPEPGREVDRTEPASPSAVTDALPSAGDVLTDPSRVARTFSSGFVLTLIVFLTAGLFNRLLERRVLSWSVWLGNRRTVGRIMSGLQEWVVQNPTRSAAVFTALSGAVLAGVDPDFGWDVVSMRLIASAVAAILVGLVGCLWLVARIADRRWQIEVVLGGIPAGVLLAAAGVLASRLLDFQPGFLVGAIIGLVVAGGDAQLAKVEKLRATLTLAIASSAWVATGLVQPAGLVSAFVRDALVVMVTALLCGLLLRLLPLPTLPGALLFRHARLTWAVLFTLTTAAFLTIVLPQPSNWLYVGDRVARWLLIAGVFAALALALYAVELRDQRRERAQHRAREKGNVA